MLIGPRPSRSSHPRRCDFLPGKRKRRAAPARGGRAKREKQIEIETISSRHAVCLLDFFVCREKRKRTSQCKHRLVPGGGRWIRPSADGPFRGSDAPPAHHSLPLPFESTRQKEKTVTPDGATVFLVGEGGFACLRAGRLGLKQIHLAAFSFCKSAFAQPCKSCGCGRSSMPSSAPGSGMALLPPARF